MYSGYLELPWWYYIIAVAVGMVVWKIRKRLSLGFLAGYAFLILAETVLIREPFVGRHFQPELFWSWRVWCEQKNQILLNIVMFIPVGILGGWMWKWLGLFAATGFSLTIEILQLITARGLMEFDDVFHNAAGAAVGIGIVMIVKKLIRAEKTGIDTKI